METTLLVALVGAIAGVIGGIIAHFTAMRTTERSSATELGLKRLEVENAVRLARDKHDHEMAFGQQTFVREIIQATLERTPEPDDQIRNLRAYAKIGLIGPPYAARILEMDKEDLPQVSGLERILSDPGVDLPVSYFERLLEVSRAVGMIRGDSPQFSSTGFLVGDGLVVTANHAIPDEATAADAVIVMDLETSASGQEKTPQEFRLDPDRLCVFVPDLDLTVVAAARRSAGGAAIGDYGRIGGAATSVRAGDRINLVHHPMGGRKRIAIREGRVLMAEETRLFYEAATSPGSGGAPVLNDSFGIVAMHHAKVPEFTERGDLRLRSGRVASRLDMPDREQIQWISCEGILWDAAIAALRARAAEGSADEAALLQTIWQ